MADDDIIKFRIVGLDDRPEVRHRARSNTVSGIRETYTIVLTRPRDCSITRMKQYIAEAVEAWSGQYRPPGGLGDDDPGDPLFGWEPNIVVRRMSKDNRDET